MERQMEDLKRQQSAILTHNFFFWPYHFVLSSIPHLALLLHGLGYSTGGPLWAAQRYVQGLTSSDKTYSTGPRQGSRLTPHGHGSQSTDSTDCYELVLTHCNLGVSIYHFITPPFPFDHVTASAYLRWCVLFREIWLMAWSRVKMQQNDQLISEACNLISRW